MRRVGVAGTRFVVFAIVAAGVMGLITFGLWNLLMPQILGLPAISFWQALGLLMLSRILFGGHGWWGRRMRRARMSGGWEGLTPEERRRFREAMGPGCPERFKEGR